MVKELREKTGAGMMDCKKALAEADGDMSKAVDILRTKGLADLAKKAGRATNEGSSPRTSRRRPHRRARRGQLRDRLRRAQRGLPGFVAGAGRAGRRRRAAGDVRSRSWRSTWQRNPSLTVEQALGELVTKLGENMGVTRFVRFEVDRTPASSAPTSTASASIGVLVEVSADGRGRRRAVVRAFVQGRRDARRRGRPLCVRREEVPADVVEHEMSIYMAQAAESGKPEADPGEDRRGPAREVLQGGLPHGAALREGPRHSRSTSCSASRSPSSARTSRSRASSASCSARALRPRSSRRPRPRSLTASRPDDGPVG